MLLLENRKFKDNSILFEEAMSGQIKFIQDDFPYSFSLGNSLAKEKLNVILSLFCAPCGDKLNELLKLSDWFEDKIYIQVSIKPDAPAASLIKEVMMHIDKDEIKRALQLLSNWYAFFQKEKDHGNYRPAAIISKWNNYYPLKSWTVEIESRYTFHSDFYENHPIPFTPMVQYNGRLLPGMYHDQELLSHRIEQNIEQEQNCEYA